MFQMTETNRLFFVGMDKPGKTTQPKMSEAITPILKNIHLFFVLPLFSIHPALT